MCDLKRMLVIANEMFKDDGMVVSIGTRHLHTKHPNDADVTILLGGHIEFNSYFHRRDAMDVMLHFNLYVKKITEGENSGRYQAGIHDTGFFVIKDKPTTAISDMAYIEIKENGS